jgi:hypothetical protein
MTGLSTGLDIAPMPSVRKLQLKQKQTRVAVRRYFILFVARLRTGFETVQVKVFAADAVLHCRPVIPVTTFIQTVIVETLIVQ